MKLDRLVQVARIVEAVAAEVRAVKLTGALLYLWWASRGARPPGKQYPFSPDPKAPRCTTCGTTAHPLRGGECPLCEDWNRKARKGAQPAVFRDPP